MLTLKSYSISKYIPLFVSVLCTMYIFCVDIYAFPAKLAADAQIITTTHNLFARLPQEPQCTTITPRSSKHTYTKSKNIPSNIKFTTNMEHQYQHIGEGWGEFLQELLYNIKHQKTYRLQNLMHPHIRPHNTPQKLKKNLLSSLSSFEVSIAKQFATYNPDRSSDDILCHEHQIFLSPQYGYPLQFFVWISLLGSQEIVRIMFTVIPTKGQLYIAASYEQRWTHNGDNAERWTAKADAADKKNDTIRAFIFYNVAKKLLSGRSFFRLTLEDRIQTYLKKTQLQTRVIEQLSEIIQDFPIRSVSPIVISQGAVGLHIYFTPPILKQTIPYAASKHSVSNEQLENHCKNTLSTLETQPWFSDIQGISCSYDIANTQNPSQITTLDSKFIVKSSKNNTAINPKPK